MFILKGYKPDAYDKALMSINRAYEDEDYDAYEARIERASKKYGYDYNKVEDDATMQRMFGVGNGE